MRNNSLYKNKYRVETFLLKYHDYLNGAYFVTIYVHQLEYVFGKIINGQMKLNKFGKIVKKMNG